VWLVVPRNQFEAYGPLARQHGCRLLGCKAQGIAATRLAIGKHAQMNGFKHFVMCDDDLKFFHRFSDSVSLHRNEPKDDRRMLRTVDKALHEYAHVAISARQGNNQLDWPSVPNRRPLRVLAYRTEIFLRAEHGRVAIMEDFDVTLQLMRMGHSNLIITEYAQDQLKTQLPGGCSDYRDHALHEANVLKLSQLHPGFVTVREKQNKTGGAFGVRTEATIYWKQALKSAVDELL
jgi:hypothetical protein